MPIQTYSVSYSTGASYIALTNVQNISISLGRNSQLDQYNASSASISLRYPTGFASPITDLVTGTFIRITNTTSGKDQFFGVINNVTARYGIPYAGGVGVSDFLDISVEGSFAKYGRYQGNGYAMPSGTLQYQIGLAGGEVYTPATFVPSGQSPTMAATTVTGTWGDWLNRSLLTINGRMIDALENAVEVQWGYGTGSSTANFSDVANNATNQVYDEINFLSLADNFFTQITVTPESASASTVSKSGASLPYRTLQTNTFNFSTGQATDFANYLLSTFGTSKFAVGSISCLAAAQNSFQLDKIGRAENGGYSLPYAIGTQITIAFRGTTINAYVEGVDVTASPSGSRYTYYLSGDDFNNVLILGSDPLRSRLDYNRLGY